MAALDPLQPFTGLLHISISDASPHFRESIEAEAGDIGDADQWWLALTITATVLVPSDPIEHVEVEVEETRLA